MEACVEGQWLVQGIGMETLTICSVRWNWTEEAFNNESEIQYNTIEEKYTMYLYIDTEDDSNDPIIDLILLFVNEPLL